MKKASSAEARRQGEHITDTALRLDDPPRPRIGLELAPQPQDLHIDTPVEDAAPR